MTTTETTTYRWIKAHKRTNTPVFRGYWDIHRDHNPGFARRVVDPIYKSLIDRISTHHYESMCEIGSDLGRSTAWFSKIASNIDVYDCNKDYIISKTDYGFQFISGVEKNNLYGVQFHPEKSQLSGIKVLKNFYERC